MSPGKSNNVTPKVIRIAQVAHYFLPHIGGIEFYVYRLARDLQKDGYRCLIASSLSSMSRGVKSKGVVKSVKYLNSINLLPRNPIMLGLNRCIKQFEPKIVHIHSIWFLPSLQVCRLRRRYQYKIINTVHGVAPDQASIPVKIFLKVYRPIAQYVIDSSDSIIVLNEVERNKLIKMFRVDAQKVHIIENGIDSANWSKQESDKVIGRIGNSYLLFTGRIIPDKNPDVLLKAFTKIARKYPNLKLVFVGPVDRAYQTALLNVANQYNDRIVFYGVLDPVNDAGEMACLYQRALLSIALGSWEGLPTRVLESMIQGTPPIVYDSGGSAGLINDRVNGYLVVDLDPVSVQKKIEHYLNSPLSFQKKMQESARASAQKYAWTEKYSQITQLYQGLLR